MKTAFHLAWVAWDGVVFLEPGQPGVWRRECGGWVGAAGEEAPAAEPLWSRSSWSSEDGSTISAFIQAIRELSQASRNSQPLELERDSKVKLSLRLLIVGF